VDVEALHAKIGQLTLENDFLAAHCWAGLYTTSSKRPHRLRRARGGRIASCPVMSTGRLFIRAIVFECG
jgi:hypothetical protein